MSSIDRQKLMRFDNVDERRARRLLNDFGDYEGVINASYRDLLEVHYIGEKTANEIYQKSKRESTQSLI